MINTTLTQLYLYGDDLKVMNDMYYVKWLIWFADNIIDEEYYIDSIESGEWRKIIQNE